MSQRRVGLFRVLEEDTNCDNRIDEHEEFVESLEKLKFARIRSIEGNKFSTPFQDIWTNLEQTHLVYFVHDSIFDTNYLRISGNDDEPKSISELGMWFPYHYYTELSTIVLEALEDGSEDEQAQAIFNFAIGFYVYDPRYLGLFEKYLKSPSVKVHLATIRAIGFQLWDECIPLLEKVIQEDSHRAVRDYAKEILRQIQQPDFDPDDLYEHPENYPNSLERVTDKAFQILPQLKDDLQVWMRGRGINLIDALDLYQYLKETDDEFKLNEELSSQATESELENTETQINAEDNSPQNEPPISTSTLEQSSKSQESESEQLKQQITQDKKQLKILQAQLTKLEAQIENSRRTNIFNRPQSGNDKKQRDRLIEEIEIVREKITQNEMLISNSEGQ